MSFNKFPAFKVKAGTGKAALRKRRQPERGRPVEKYPPENADFTKWPEYAPTPQGGENVRNYRYLTLADREKLESHYLKGERPQDIADTLGVHVATIYKELKRGDTGDLDCNMRQGYNAKLAQLRLQQNLKRRGSKAKPEQQKLETVTT